MDIILGVVLALVVAMIMWSMRQTSNYQGSSWTVYGTDECGWTRKQLKEMDDKGVKYTYINCKDGGCGELKSFPTLKSDDSGEVKVGFTRF